VTDQVARFDGDRFVATAITLLTVGCSAAVVQRSREPQLPNAAVPVAATKTSLGLR